MKTLVFLAAIFLGFRATNWNKHFLLYAVIELGLIYLLRLLFVGKSKAVNVVGYLLTSVIAFLYLVNMGSQVFAGSYVNYLMWSNLANIQALGSSLPLYIGAVVLALVISFIPMKTMELPRLLRLTDLGVIVVAYVLIFVLSLPTPLSGWITFLGDYRQAQQTAQALAADAARKRSAAYKEFAHTGIAQGIDTKLDKPNVIVIFTEGFSSEIMGTNNGNTYPNLTPNLDKFSQQTISFTDYFNHTAATYRGVRGQLSSSQQYLEGYENGIDGVKKMTTTELDSVQSILGEQGYATEFINAEPNQPTWTPYIKNLGFQKVKTLPENQLTKASTGNFISDQDNYALLLKEARRLNKADKPFMLADYTFQTHVGLDSDLKYGDGSNPYLNKFHNVDDAFGKFWEAFQQSDMAKNTIIVFTADHATYPDPTYSATFGTTRNYFLSPIPMMIWYPGLTDPRSIDAGGRNSLATAPTILDLVGIRNVKNYFLGNSLFSSHISPMEYVFSSSQTMASTEGVTEADTKANKNLTLPATSPLVAELQRYYSISLNY